jgi:hypothetical protein
VIKTENGKGDTVKIQLNSFNGQECLIILKYIDFVTIFPKEKYTEFWNDRNSNFGLVFNDFYRIYINLKTNFYQNNIELLEKDSEGWLKSFLESTHVKHVTPYLHLFSNHLCFFVEKFGDVNLFNIQGLEKFNDETTKLNFKSSNRKLYLSNDKKKKQG